MNINKNLNLLLLLLTLFFSIPVEVSAHGEKALEPFIRMRTVQWYDLQWSNGDLKVNDELTITGKFHVAKDWPINVPNPDATYLNVATPGPVFIRTERYINGQPALSSFKLEKGGDYAFKIVLKARIPGRYHIHPFFNLFDAGAVVGPGQWVEVGGDASDFSNQIELLNGKTIDMESYGLSNAVYWHALWIIAGTVWLLWWLRRPLFIQRYKMLEMGQEDVLVTDLDKNIAKGILVAVALVVLVGYISATNNHPTAIPLQAARDQIEPLSPLVNTGDVKLKVKRVVYRVPDRSMKLDVELENRTDSALRIGELSVANVRFMNPDVAVTSSENTDVDSFAAEGLILDDNTAIAAGESRKISIIAQDAAWETQRLDGLIRDADSRMGGLLFLYDADDNRHIISLSAPVIPEFISKK